MSSGEEQREKRDESESQNRHVEGVTQSRQRTYSNDSADMWERRRVEGGVLGRLETNILDWLSSVTEREWILLLQGGTRLIWKTKGRLIEKALELCLICTKWTGGIKPRTGRIFLSRLVEGLSLP